MAERLDITLVVARGLNGVIGRDGALPWRMASDLKHFRAVTMGKPVIMGRRTWQSLGKPLPGRRNIVVSRDAGFRAAGALHATCPEVAVSLATAVAYRAGAREIYVIGGGEIYRAFMPVATRILLSEIQLAPDGDVRFDTPDTNTWRRTASTVFERGAGDDAAFFVDDWRRQGFSPQTV